MGYSAFTVHRHRGAMSSDGLIYQMISEEIEKKEGGIHERCDKCRRELNGENSQVLRKLTKRIKRVKSVYRLCSPCGTYELRMKLGTLDQRDINKHLRYVEIGNQEFNERILKAFL